MRLLGWVVLYLASSKYTYVMKMNRLFSRIILKGGYTEPLSKATLGFDTSVCPQ
jgi:hypothetical protein